MTGELPKDFGFSSCYGFRQTKYEGRRNTSYFILEGRSPGQSLIVTNSSQVPQIVSLEQ